MIKIRVFWCKVAATKFQRVRLFFCVIVFSTHEPVNAGRTSWMSFWHITRVKSRPRRADLINDSFEGLCVDRQLEGEGTECDTHRCLVHRGKGGRLGADCSGQVSETVMLSTNISFVCLSVTSRGQRVKGFLP